ncbi:MAG: hypothetical protein ACREH8_17520 [Opitutaceae bacterium]
MKRYAPFVLLATGVLVVIAPLLAATAAAPAPGSDRSPIAPIATAISTVTGIAISPLLGTSAYGAYKYFSAKDGAAREALPWYAKMSFWLPALLLVAACAAKDAFGTVVPPGLKKPLDVLETIENKFSGLVAAGAVIPFAMDAMRGMLFDGGAPTAAAPMLAQSGLATIQLGAFEPSWMLNLLTVPFGVAIFVLVWLGSHAINVLILLSPWGAIDAVLKAARTALLGLITLTATMNPWVSAALSLVVVVIAYFIAGWAFRLTVFGTIFSWEFITRRCRRFTPAEDENKVFAGAHFPGVPVRTYGRLAKRGPGELEFVYRPWLFMGQQVELLPNEPRFLSVGTGACFSDIVDEEDRTVFSLPPRYRGHEQKVAAVYALDGVRPIGLHKAWSELREMLGGRAVKRAPLAA